MPPVQQVEDTWLGNVDRKQCGRSAGLPVRSKGYPPPVDACIYALAVDADLESIEVKPCIRHKRDSYRDHHDIVRRSAACAAGGPKKVMVDGGIPAGRWQTTYMGEDRPQPDSPLLRRPDYGRASSLMAETIRGAVLSFSGAFSARPGQRRGSMKGPRRTPLRVDIRL